MNSTDLRISVKNVWFLVIGNFLLIFLGAFAKIQHVEYPQILLTIGLIFGFSAWVIIFSDMVKNKIHNKTFWILSIFILPIISTIFYLIRRNQLIRIGERLG